MTLPLYPVSIPATFKVDAADFDGTNDSMARTSDLTDNADGKSGIFSGWVRLDGGDGSSLAIVSQNAIPNRFRVLRFSSNKFAVSGFNGSNTLILDLVSTTSYTAAATWLHVLASWDLASGAGHLYINDADDLAASPTLTNDTIDYTNTDWGVGIGQAFSRMHGAMAEIYFAPNQYLDFSVAANRRRFITPGGKPVNLGADGSSPTGVPPLVYLGVTPGAAASTFATNRGTGGNFTITGSLDIASSSPSD